MQRYQSHVRLFSGCADHLSSLQQHFSVCSVDYSNSLVAPTDDPKQPTRTVTPNPDLQGSFVKIDEPQTAKRNQHWYQGGQDSFGSGLAPAAFFY